MLEGGFEPISKHQVCCLHSLSSLQDPLVPHLLPRPRRHFWQLGRHHTSRTLAVMAGQCLKGQPQHCRQFRLLGSSPIEWFLVYGPVLPHVLDEIGVSQPLPLSASVPTRSCQGCEGPRWGIRHPRPDLPTVRAGSLFYLLQGRLAQKGLLSLHSVDCVTKTTGSMKCQDGKSKY